MNRCILVLAVVVVSVVWSCKERDEGSRPRGDESAGGVCVQSNVTTGKVVDCVGMAQDVCEAQSVDFSNPWHYEPAGVCSLGVCVEVKLDDSQVLSCKPQMTVETCAALPVGSSSHWVFKAGGVCAVPGPTGGGAGGHDDPPQPTVTKLALDCQGAGIKLGGVLSINPLDGGTVDGVDRSATGELSVTVAGTTKPLVFSGTYGDGPSFDLPFPHERFFLRAADDSVGAKLILADGQDEVVSIPATGPNQTKYPVTCAVHPVGG